MQKKRERVHCPFQMLPLYRQRDRRQSAPTEKRKLSGVIKRDLRPCRKSLQKNRTAFAARYGAALHIFRFVVDVPLDTVYDHFQCDEVFAAL